MKKKVTFLPPVMDERRMNWRRDTEEGASKEPFVKYFFLKSRMQEKFEFF